MKKLTFEVLRTCNRWRVGHFKNKHGQRAHSKPDGSDWSPAQWFRAMVGEIGELAEVRLLYESGQMTFDEYSKAVEKELADVQIYLDLFAARALDSTTNDTREPDDMDPAQMLMAVVAHLGTYANNHKKFERGDIGEAELDQRAHRSLREVEAWLDHLTERPLTRSNYAVRQAHPVGVLLDEAVREKFNEVSHRIGVQITIDENGEARNEP